MIPITRSPLISMTSPLTSKRYTTFVVWCATIVKVCDALDVRIASTRSNVPPGLERSRYHAGSSVTM
jgi:hypothetical protein